MNNVQLVGRLVRDPSESYTTGENSNAYCRFTVAVNRRFKNKETNQYDADFISCIAFGTTSEFINKYFKKGQMIGVVGSIRTGSYEKDGQKVYTTDIYVDNVEFVGSKNENGDNNGNINTSTSTSKPDIDMSFMNVPSDDVEFPFT